MEFGLNPLHQIVNGWPRILITSRDFYRLKKKIIVDVMKLHSSHAFMKTHYVHFNTKWLTVSLECIDYCF